VLETVGPYDSLTQSHQCYCDYGVLADVGLPRW